MPANGSFDNVEVWHPFPCIHTAWEVGASFIPTLLIINLMMMRSSIISAKSSVLT